LAARPLDGLANHDYAAVAGKILRHYRDTTSWLEKGMYAA
jgi:hypothetical protein